MLSLTNVFLDLILMPLSLWVDVYIYIVDRIEGSVTGQSDADSCLPHNLFKFQIIFEKNKLKLCHSSKTTIWINEKHKAL
jgi:hypothetical protein